MELRIHQLAAAVLLSLAGASALVLIDGASKKHGGPERTAALAKTASDVRPIKAEQQTAVALAAQPPAPRSPAARAPVAPQPMAQTASALPLAAAPAAAPALAMQSPAAQSPADAGANQQLAEVRSVRTETIVPPSDRGIDLRALGNVGAASAFAATQNTPDPFNDAKAGALTDSKPPRNAADALTKAKVVAAAAPTSLQDPPGVSSDAKATESQDAAQNAAKAGLPACMPAPLQTALAAVEARFSGVKVVSTTHLNTDNHSHGSVREKMHLNCRAIDIKTSGNQRQIAAFLHTRPEVGGVEAYRNHVVHFDLNPNYAKAVERVIARGGHGSR
jgi:hypothetical protein